jgi:hypothetical protein
MMVAFVPTCKRERKSAASHTDATDAAGITVAAGSDSNVFVGEARRAGAGSAGLVSVEDGGCDCGGETDVDETETIVGCAVSGCSVTAGSIEGGVFGSLVGNKVSVGPTDCQGEPLIEIKNRISKTIATVNLNKS